MPLLEWKDDYLVDVRVIDNQHKRLVDLLNKLFDSMVAGMDKSVIVAVLDDLIHYTKTHFTTEEMYFERFNYVATKSHIAEHVKFVDQIKEFKQDFEDGKISVSQEVVDFLKNWLLSHIGGSDKQYTATFHANGVR